MKVGEVVGAQEIQRNQFGLTKDQIVLWLHNHKLYNYTINQNLTVNVKGHCTIHAFEKIPIKFNHVSGIFNCAANGQKTFDFLPMSAHIIYFEGNKVISFHNIHKVVEYLGYKFSIYHYRAEDDATLIIPTHLLGFCLIKGIKNLVTGSAKINELFEQYKDNMLMFQQHLIDAGFPEQAKL